MSVSVRTVADKRVVAEQGVVLNQYVGPLNWEHYRIPASGLSNTQLTFANLVTLGTNRLYDSSFQIEYTIEVGLTAYTNETIDYLQENIRMRPFPLHWVTDQLRVNVNGAACMTRPQENLFQRMMYWRQSVLDKTCSFCPHTKAPVIEDEPYQVDAGANTPSAIANHWKKYGKNGSQNIGTPLPCVQFKFSQPGILSITIREPVLCPPFNQRLDQIYASPLFNITSIDLVYQLNDLRSMFFGGVNYRWGDDSNWHFSQPTVLLPTNMDIRITDAQLCFNVASMPTGMTVPPMLQLPYYDNVCYVTNANFLDTTTGTREITSGVYTLAQVPTAIYLFVSENQLFRSNPALSGDHSMSLPPIRNVNITMGNNTQLLVTTSEFDRYQMALANGLEDVSWEEFHTNLIPFPGRGVGIGTGGRLYGHSSKCILRLIPGVDLLIPDKRLVGGTDAEQMVFQARVQVDIDGVPSTSKPYLSLWLMFEYCGILTIEPVHASIDMIPLKTTPAIGSIDTSMDTSVEATHGGGEGTNPKGAGIWDWISGGYKALKGLWNSGIGKTVRGAIDNVLDSQPPTKKVSGGAIIGGSDFYT